ncbi:MAG: DUF1592 domain-containing protein [Verrucomicrobiae bacterium]|nr:DUF1592 domain-containing protein [Verrucomicrobiae bacterium]
MLYHITPALNLRLQLISILLAGAAPFLPAFAEESAHQNSACSASDDDFFSREVWGKVANRACLKCHQAGGDAEDSDFILRDPARDVELGDVLAHNRAAFTRMAMVQEGDVEGQPYRMLSKVIGGLDHGGEDVVNPGSMRYRILEEFVSRVNGHSLAAPGPGRQALPFFQGVEMMDDGKLLRRLTLSLAARLPKAEERESVATHGLGAMPSILDALMSEEAFYERLAEGFNDIFLTPGIDDVAENVLSYEHFEKTRHWYQNWDFADITDEKERERAGWKLAADYRDSMQREPMELVKHIVRNNRPFTELITADYIMVSPYTARGYGIFDEVHMRFKDPENRLEYIPVRLKALTGRSEKTNQDSATGYYPHAGILSTFQYLKRYPTTETNRNRLRVRMYFQQFLGIDIMQLAPRVNDAAAITAKYEIPTMQAADCVVCHKIIDPVAGVFQDYYALDGNGVYKKRDEGWFQDMFPPGHEGEYLPESERWRGLQWLGERTASDPRFAVAMVEHVWYILTGRKALLPPRDIEDPLFDFRQRAYYEQRSEFAAIAQRFTAANFNLKVAFRELSLSKFYRADGLTMAQIGSARTAELSDLGLVRLLTPEQLERKIAAIFGKPWGRLEEQFKILYGGIDTKEVTERIADPSGAMGAIQRLMANEVACKNVIADFLLDPEQRRLFPEIELEVVPGKDTESVIRAAIKYLHQHILGSTDPAEIDRSYTLFTDIIADARKQGDIDKLEIYHCRAEPETRIDDPDYTLRSWRALVTYLLRQQEFLYE